MYYLQEMLVQFLQATHGDELGIYKALFQLTKYCLIHLPKY